MHNSRCIACRGFFYLLTFFFLHLSSNTLFVQLAFTAEKERETEARLLVEGGGGGGAQRCRGWRSRLERVGVSENTNNSNLSGFRE